MAPSDTSSLLQDIDESSDTHQDNLRAFQLRYRFADHKFDGLVWHALRACGWTHQSRGYVAPDGRKFTRAEYIIDRLDRFSLEPLRGNLQSPEEEVSNIERDEDDTLWRQWRHEVLEWMFAKVQTDETKSEPNGKRSAIVAERPRRASLPAKSTTAAEKGTDLYLHRNSKGRKAKNASLPADISTASFKNPSLAECAKLTIGDDEHVEEQEARHRQDFGDWRFRLSTNHSLLLYGAGSKYELLNEFAEKELSKEGYVVAIDGFDAEADIDSILDLLVDSFLDGKEPSALSRISHADGNIPVVGQSNPWRAHPTVERAIAVSRGIAYKASESLLPVFLVIHNLDSTGLRNPLAQDALAALLVNSNVENGVAAIRLVASIDHVDASLMWSVPVIANMNWMYIQVHTHRPYVKELVMLEETKRTRSKQAATRSQALAKSKTQFQGTLTSLAPRHAEAIQILARLQLSLPSNQTWVNYVEFRKQCTNNCVVNKETNLATLLVDLIDHGLVQVEIKEEEELKLVTIPFERAKVKEMLRLTRGENNGKRGGTYGNSPS